MTSMGASTESKASEERIKRPGLERVAVVIPAWKPGPHLLRLVEALLGRGCGPIVVVDDGSGTAYAPIFAELRLRRDVFVCTHAVNSGKGRSLKTAFAHILEHVPGLAGIVTADADGQHLPDDIVRVAQGLLNGEGDPLEAPVLGIRTFGPAVPWRSRLGNAVSAFIFTLLAGCAVRDTQTGLRGLPLSLLPGLLALPGERYEYEMTMLVALCRHCGPPCQIPIETVYLEGNRGSHFRPLHDSVRVLAALLRTVVSSRVVSWPQRTPQPPKIQHASAGKPALHSV